MSLPRNISVFVTFLGLAGSVRADKRPPAAIEADRRALEVEKETLARRKAELESSLDERRGTARARLRGLVRLSHGGFARILVGAVNPSDYYRRKGALARIVARDAAEARALHEELRELTADRGRIDDLERRVRALDGVESGPPAFAIEPGGLVRPVGGPLIAAYGPTRDVRTGAEVFRDGVGLAARPGESVKALATGGVLGVVDLPAAGKAVVMDHGAGWRSVIAGLAEVRVTTGGYVVAGGELGRAFGSTIEVQLVQDGTWIDPAPWLAPHVPPPPLDALPPPSMTVSPVHHGAAAIPTFSDH